MMFDAAEGLFGNREAASRWRMDRTRGFALGI